MLAIAVAASPAPAAHAERRLHGSVGAGGALLLTGGRGDRAAVRRSTVDLKPRQPVRRLARVARVRRRRTTASSRAGLVYEAAAARPRLVLDLHARRRRRSRRDGAARSVAALRTTLAIVGPLGVVLDAGAYLVLDGIDDTRLQLQSSTILVARW